MAPGECYAALGDGRFERRQLGMLADGPATEDANPEDAGDDEPTAAEREEESVDQPRAATQARAHGGIVPLNRRGSRLAGIEFPRFHVFGTPNAL